MRVEYASEEPFCPIALTLENERELRLLYKICNRNLTIEKAIEEPGTAEFLGDLYKALYGLTSRTS